MADRDLQMVTLARDPDDASDESFGFHVQQAAEKCFKAWLALLGHEYPLTHELGALIDGIRPHDDRVTEFADLVRFSPFAVKFRYEPLPEDAAPIDRPAAIQQIESLRRAVERLFPSPESSRARALTIRTTPADTRDRGPANRNSGHGHETSSTSGGTATARTAGRGCAGRFCRRGPSRGTEAAVTCSGRSTRAG